MFCRHRAVSVLKFWPALKEMAETLELQPEKLRDLELTHPELHALLTERATKSLWTRQSKCVSLCHQLMLGEQALSAHALGYYTLLKALWEPHTPRVMHHALLKRSAGERLDASELHESTRRWREQLREANLLLSFQHTTSTRHVLFEHPFPAETYELWMKALQASESARQMWSNLPDHQGFVDAHLLWDFQGLGFYNQLDRDLVVFSKADLRHFVDRLVWNDVQDLKETCLALGWLAKLHATVNPKRAVTLTELRDTHGVPRETLSYLENHGWIFTRAPRPGVRRYVQIPPARINGPLTPLAVWPLKNWETIEKFDTEKDFRLRYEEFQKDESDGFKVM